MRLIPGLNTENVCLGEIHNGGFSVGVALSNEKKSGKGVKSGTIRGPYKDKVLKKYTLKLDEDLVNKIKDEGFNLNKFIREAIEDKYYSK